jgi:hypothetical protein
MFVTCLTRTGGRKCVKGCVNVLPTRSCLKALPLTYTTQTNTVTTATHTQHAECAGT